MRSKVDDPDTVWRYLDLADARVRITERGRVGGDRRAAVRDGHVAGVPPDRGVAGPAHARGWDRLPAAGVERTRPSAAGRPLLRFRPSARRSTTPTTGDSSIRWSGSGRAMALAIRCAGARLRSNHLKTGSPARSLPTRPLVEGSRSAACVRPVLPRRARDPGRADERDPRRHRRVRARLSAHDPVAAAAGPMALLAAMGVVDPDGPWEMGDLDVEDGRDFDGLGARFDYRDHRAYMVWRLTEAAGSDDDCAAR